ncbi:MAG TPA: primosomal protein N' [Bacteroidetes bacterium]|nr:primosomal protein N' [Bacteroidota bacterium]
MQQAWFSEEEEDEVLTDTLFADVILPFSLPSTFTYRVPREWNETIAVGKRVVVPFGKKKYYSGMVLHVGDQPPKGYEAKYLNAILDEFPILNTVHLKFWTWIASYYLCNMGDVMNAALPAGLKLASETRLLPDPDADLLNTPMSDAEKQIMEVLMRKEVLTITEVQEITGIKNVFPLIKSLYHKQLVYTGEEMKERYTPKLKTYIRLNPEYADDQALKVLLDGLEKRAGKQADVVLKYLVNSPKREWLDKLHFQKSGDIGAPAIKALLDKSIFIAEERRVDRLDSTSSRSMDYTLNAEQEQAKIQIKSFWKDKEVVLLHGITGSGKSFIYFDLIREALDRGEQVLYLLPEIALTVQLVGKLRAVFKEHVYISHSRFNENERVEVYKKVSSGEPCVVIGARSSIFLPFQQLGLLVIDEEHEPSFKQYDPAPRYHGRDAGIMLATLFKARVILGSATPSIESYYNAKTEKYGLVSLKNRFGDSSLPAIELVDLAAMKRKGEMRQSFSLPLLESIESSIKHDKQVILFQNRKGYVPIILCNQCGWTLKCISCDISMTYYKSSDLMKCNYCGYSQRPVKVCPTCGSAHLEMSGFGTEMIEEELKLLHPTYRISRFDQSSIRGKHAHHRIVHEFEDHELDILVGTQMLAKGLDFEGVNLVGVMQADQLLNFPHFRAHERAFQLLTQVAGRAGRREEKGKVMIQTYKKEHPVLEDVINHDYARFFTIEIAEREKFHYPPFTKLIEISLKSMELPLLEKAAAHLAVLFKAMLGSRVLGPETPYVSKIRNFHIRRMLVKLDRDKTSHLRVKQDMRKILEDFHADKKWRAVRVQFDVDPA